MYTREEVKRIKEQFWTAFGQYMGLSLSAEFDKINWINYRTGIKNLHFRMDADKRSAIIMIEMSHADASMRGLMFEQFEAYKSILHDALGEEWIWEQDAENDYGKPIARIYTRISGVNIFQQADWTLLIEFFKPRLKALDAFWCDVKDGFELFK